MTTMILHGGHFGGQEVEVEDPEAIIEMTDDEGKVWVYNPALSTPENEAVFQGMKAE